MHIYLLFSPAWYRANTYFCRRRQEAGGNVFAQLIHDGGTLANRKKYQVLALQFIKPAWNGNCIVALALAPSADNTAFALGALVQELIQERTGYALSLLTERAVSDCAALYLADYLEIRKFTGFLFACCKGDACTCLLV